MSGTKWMAEQIEKLKNDYSVQNWADVMSNITHSKNDPDEIRYAQKKNDKIKRQTG